MAGSIMSLAGQAPFLLLCLLLVCFLQVFSRGQVVHRSQASGFLRSKRANMYLLEEILQGNLERECYEEMCNFEEAREYFENDQKTISFWTVYYDGDQCDPNPCLHGGNCTDKVGGFQCSCPAHYYGSICQLDAEGEPGGRGPPTSPQVTAPAVLECPTEGPTACQQQCTVSYRSFTCSCTAGFKLQSDGRSCLPEVEFPCGRIPDKFNASTSMCLHGNCPWQVSLLNSEGAELCGGVLLGRRTVLTAAHCLRPELTYSLLPLHFSVLTGDQKIHRVKALYIHNRFRPNRHNYDLALIELAEPLVFGPDLIHLCLPTKDFSENVLMHPGRRGMSGSRGRSRRTQELVYMTLEECRSNLNVSLPLGNKMFCMKSQAPSPLPVLGRRSQHNAHRTRNNQTLGNEHSGPGLQRNRTLTQDASKAFNVENPMRSEGSRRGCLGPLPGSPVATVEQGTAFLTGLLMSTPTDCDGMVFSKLSRYVTWIRPRVDSAEQRTTTQTGLYPDGQHRAPFNQEFWAHGK